jgi:hypothetical protein
MTIRQRYGTNVVQNTFASIGRMAAETQVQNGGWAYGALNHSHLDGILPSGAYQMADTQPVISFVGTFTVQEGGNTVIGNQISFPLGNTSSSMGIEISMGGTTFEHNFLVNIPSLQLFPAHVRGASSTRIHFY